MRELGICSIRDESPTKQPEAQLQSIEAHLLVAQASDSSGREAQRGDAKAQRGQRIHADVVLRQLDYHLHPCDKMSRQVLPELTAYGSACLL